jgi:hypothetical protein
MEFTQSAKHRNWSTARKNRARDTAALIGRMDTLKVQNRILASVGVVAFFAGMIGAVELIESINL